MSNTCNKENDFKDIYYYVKSVSDTPTNKCHIEGFSGGKSQDEGYYQVSQFLLQKCHRS